MVKTGRQGQEGILSYPNRGRGDFGDEENLPWPDRSTLVLYASHPVANSPSIIDVFYFIALGRVVRDYLNRSRTFRALLAWQWNRVVGQNTRPKEKLRTIESGRSQGKFRAAVYTTYGVKNREIRDKAHPKSAESIATR
ncbi:hypothetical protein IQ235_01295 [Oscillatoriales cyanobacterium LEGE 11467]|uniref:Uncharacterized protein n=1 Tax=Zarconia navalis LEGE 11467 TaxID=1828826 RepID=A0A928Z839_9CYAN|nr:hypothetical protein [Zarconia navalis]MBE9039431.1 hypothetical protein [Zarconia navalis LEGE 11467]